MLLTKLGQYVNEMMAVVIKNSAEFVVTFSYNQTKR